MKTKKFITAVVVASVGIFLVLLGADIIPQRIFRPNVPSSMLVVVGLGLILPAIAVFIGIGSTTANRLIGLSMILIAVAFAWTALFGDPRHMEGGIPFIPGTMNWFIGRIVFGLVALFFLWVGVLALSHVKERNDKRDVNSDVDM